MLRHTGSIAIFVACLVGYGHSSTQVNPKCPCVGTNYQVDDNADGKVATLKLGLYDATYGEKCGSHAEPGASACTGANPLRGVALHGATSTLAFAMGPLTLVNLTTSLHPRQVANGYSTRTRHVVPLTRTILPSAPGLARQHAKRMMIVLGMEMLAQWR
jgi:hypothetical protein